MPSKVITIAIQFVFLAHIFSGARPGDHFNPRSAVPPKMTELGPKEIMTLANIYSIVSVYHRRAGICFVKNEPCVYLEVLRRDGRRQEFLAKHPQFTTK